MIIIFIEDKYDGPTPDAYQTPTKGGPGPATTAQSGDTTDGDQTEAIRQSQQNSNQCCCIVM